MYIVKGNYIFFHIPKTGGKSIYRYFLERDMLEFATSHTSYNELISERQNIKLIFKPKSLQVYKNMSKLPEHVTNSDEGQWEKEKNEMLASFENIIRDPVKEVKNYRMFATIRNPIDWYISFYNHAKHMPTKDNDSSFTKICSVLTFKDFIREYVENANVGLYTKMVCNQIMSTTVSPHKRINDEQRKALYDKLQVNPITFLKIEKIREEMLNHVPEICSDLEKEEFLHVNRGVVGPPTSSGREEYLDFFEKSHKYLLQKYDIIREKDNLIFEKAGY